MKTILDCTMEVLTPCLCAGADQSVAEIRAPSIRGELRWWLRALGGDKKEEAEIFGSAAGSSGAASNVVVRVSEHNSGTNPKVALTSNQAFFTSARSGPDAKVPAGSTFRLQLLKRRDFSSKCFDRALECFARVGAIGLRANRGCGALQIKDWRPSGDQARNWLLQLKQHHFNIYVFEQKPRYLDTLSLLEEQMKQFRVKNNISKDSEDSLGYISGDKTRQSSCLKYRPVKLSDNTFLPVMLYTEVAIGDKTISRKDEISHFFNQYAL